jgi:hypothetical protein
MELESQQAAALGAYRAQSYATLLEERKEHNKAIKEMSSQRTKFRKELEHEYKLLDKERKEH